MRSQTATKNWLLLAAAPLIILGFFYVMPVMQLFRFSFDQYDPIQGRVPAFELAQYIKLVTDSYYLSILIRTIVISSIATVVCIPLAYPITYYLVFNEGRKRNLLFMTLLVPLVTSVIVVAYGWLIMLGQTGVINGALISLGIITTPLHLMYTPAGIIVALIHVQLVFMVLSLSGAVRAIDYNLVKAARNLGAGYWTAFWRIEFPLSLIGLRTGILLVFSLNMSAYAIPTLIGGPRSKVLSSLIYEQAVSILNWPLAAALAVVLLITTGLIVGLVYSIRR